MSIITSDSIKAISAALLKFQGAVDGVARTTDNPAFKRNFKYATLENVRDTAVPVLQEVGIVFIQSGGAIVENVMAMTTRLIHAESGEWIEGTMDIALGKPDPQGVGSAQTYAQRYHLMAMLGLPPVDDDGEAAMDRNNQRPAPVHQKAAPEAPPEPQGSPVAAMGTLAIDKLIGMKNTAQRALWGRLQIANREVTTLAEFDGLWAHMASKAAYDGFPPDWQKLMDDEKRDKEAELREKGARHNTDEFEAGKALARSEKPYAPTQSANPNLTPEEEHAVKIASTP